MQENDTKRNDPVKQQDEPISQNRIDGTDASTDAEATELESKSEVRKSRKFPNWGDFFMCIGVFVVSNILAGVVMSLIFMAKGVELTTKIPAELSWIIALVQIITFVPLIFFIIYLRRRAGYVGSGLHWGFRRINPPFILWGVIFVLITGVIIEPLLNLLPDAGMDKLEDMIGKGGWSILSVVVIAPVLEEILFRGLIIDSVRKRLGTMIAVLFSAVLFGLAHGIPQQSLNAFVVALILGYIYVRTDSLAAVMIIHAINNAMAYVLLEFFGSSTVTFREMIGNNTLYYIIYGASLVIFIVAMVKLVITLRNGDEIVDAG